MTKCCLEENRTGKRPGRPVGHTHVYTHFTSRSYRFGLSALQLACVTLCILPYLRFIWNIWCISIICDFSLSLFHHYPFLLFFHTISNHLAHLVSLLCWAEHVCCDTCVGNRNKGKQPGTEGKFSNKLIAFVCVFLRTLRAEHQNTFFHDRDHFKEMKIFELVLPTWNGQK